MIAKHKDLTGKQFGLLTVIERAGRNKHRRALWLCKCKCGNNKVITGAGLTRGNTNSCGCSSRNLASEKITTHGNAGKGKNRSTEYHTWSNMIQRCGNSNSKYYDIYGGRGISVCERWSNSFEDFLEDMGKKPSLKHSIDRIDVNGNYEPNNCKWSTQIEQMRNIRVRNKSGVKGVYFDDTSKKWRSFIKVNYKGIYLGSFDNFDDAVKSRKDAELKYWKESS